MRSLISLFIAASLLSGCTIAGGLIGNASASGPAPTAARPYRKDSDAKSILIGAAVGLALDLIVIHALTDGDFTVVPTGHDH